MASINMSDAAIFERLADALCRLASAKGLTCTRPDGKVHIEIQRGVGITVRDRGTSGLRGDGVVAIVARLGDDFSASQPLAKEGFDLVVVAGVNVWTAEGAIAPTFTDDELAEHVLTNLY